MAKVIKTAVIAAAVAFLTIVTAGVIAPTLVGATGSALVALAGKYALISGIGTLVAGGVGLLTSRGLEATRQNFGTKVAGRAASAPRPIVYGFCRVGGTIVKLHTSGTSNHKLHLTIALAGHEIESLEGVYFFNSLLSTTSSFVSHPDGGANQTFFKVNHTKFVNTENENRFDSNGTLVHFTFHDGSQTRRCGLAATNAGSRYPTSAKFGSIAYVYMELIYDPEKLPSIPPISFRIKGKKLYDPRTGNTEWSANPALAIRDFLTDTTYGLRAQSTEINDSTSAGGFAAAANDCDAQVTLEDGTTQSNRFTANGFTNMGASGDGVLEGLLSAMGGKITYTNGKFNLFSATAQTPSLTINDDVVFDVQQLSTKSGGGDLYNGIKSLYVDSINNFTAAESPTLLSNTFLAQDTPSGQSSLAYKKIMEAQLPFTTTHQRAQRLQKIQLLRHRESAVISMLTSLNFFKLQPADWVYVTNERFGFTNKVFEVITTTMEFVEDDGKLIALTRLVLQETSAATFNFITSEYSTPITDGSEPPTGDRSIGAPTVSGSDGSVAQRSRQEGPTAKIDLLVTWTNALDSGVQGTEIQYRENGVTPYNVATLAGRGSTSGVIQGVQVGKVYDVRIRHFSWDNVFSSFVTYSQFTVTEPDTIAGPTNLAATTDKPFFIELTWTNPTNANYRAVEIHTSTSSGFTPSNSTLLNTYYGEPAKQKKVILGVSAGLAYDTNHFFKARSVNVYGTQSAFTAQVTGKFVQASGGDIAADAITANKIDVSQLSAISADLGSITGGSLNINSGQFTVSSLGAMVAQSATVTGSITASSFTIASGASVSGLDASFVDGLPQATFTSIGANTFSPTVNGSQIRWVDGGQTVAWNTKLVTDNGFLYGAFIQFTVGTANARYMIGLADVNTGNSYTFIDFAIFVRGSSNDYRVYESGVDQGQIKSGISTGDVATVIYDGTKVRYYINGTLEKTTTVSTPFSSAVFGHVAIDDGVTGTNTIDDLRFGQYTSVLSGIEDGVTITGGGIVMSSGGAVKTINKDSESDTTNGFFLGYNSSTTKYTFGVGDNTKSMVWDGTNLTVTGTIVTDDITLSSGASLTDTDGKIANVAIDLAFPVGELSHYWPCNSIADVDGDGNEELQDVVGGTVGVHSGTSAPTISNDSPSGRAVVLSDGGFTLLTNAQANSLEASGGFAWSFWFKSESTSGNSSARLITRDFSDKWAVTIDQSGSGAQALTLAGEPSTTSMGTVTANEWHHFAFSENGSGTISGYVDGELIGTVGYTPVSSSRPVVLGVNTETSISPPTEAFVGKIAEVRAYNRPFTPIEVRALFKNPLGGLPAKIDGDLLVTGSVTADSLAANSVTAGKITVTNLSDIAANAGSLTGGNLGASAVTISSTSIFQGTGAFGNANTGFFLGNDGKFSIEDKLVFDGSQSSPVLTLKGNLEAEQVSVGTGATRAVMASAGDVRFWAGTENPSATTPFVVQSDGKVQARNLVLTDEDGNEFFNAQEGFSALAITQLVTTIDAAKITEYSEALTDDSDEIQVTFSQASNVTFTASINANFAGNGQNAVEATALANAKAEIPDNFKIELRRATTSGFSSSQGTLIAEQTFTKTEGTPSSTQYKIQGISFDLEGFTAIAYANTVSGVGAVGATGRVAITATLSSLPANTYFIKAFISTTDSSYNTSQNPVTSSAGRTVAIKDNTSQGGFTVDGGNAGQSVGAADITSVAITTNNGISGGGSVASGAASFTLGLGAITPSSVTTTGDVEVGGNLTVNGTTTTLNTATLQVEDKNIVLNYGTGNTTSSANGAGITIQDAVSSTTDATMLWNTTDDTFEFSHGVTSASKVKGASLETDRYIYHAGDTNTYIDFGTDSISLHAGGGNGAERIIVSAASIQFREGLQFLSNVTDGALVYQALESGSSVFRNILNLDLTNNASYPIFTNRTPSGKVVIAGGTSAAGGEIERLEVEGGDGTKAVNLKNNTVLAIGGVTAIDESRNASLNIITVADDIRHQGDTDTKIVFGTNTISLQTGGAERLGLSDSGVSFSTLSVSSLTVANSSTPILTLSDTGNAGGGGASAILKFKNTGGDAMGIGYTGDDTSDSDMIISTHAGGTFGARLGLDAGGITDASADIILEPKTNVRVANGNLLVGTTTTLGASDLTGGETGFAARSNGLTIASRDSGTTLLVNRGTSDGDIAVFQKDGTTVGNIGSEAGDMTVAFAGAGLRFVDGTNSIQPFSATTGGRINDSVTLGDASFRFKDIFSKGLDITTGTTNSVNLVVTDDVANEPMTGVFIDFNSSGSTPALTTDRNKIALQIDLDSSATAGGTQHEHRLYGIHNVIKATGDSDLIHGAFFSAEAQHTSGTVSSLYGLDVRSAVDPAGTATVNNSYAVHAYNNATGASGSTISSMYGVFAKSELSAGNDCNVNNIYGLMAETEFETSGTATTVSNSYVIRSFLDQNSSDTTITNGYLLYGSYGSTTNVTNPYGIFIATSVRNYINGTIETGDGSTSVVSYGFISDRNTGMYSPSNHALGFAQNGTQRLLLDATGATVTGAFTATGAVNSSSNISTGGTIRLSASGNLSNIGTISSNDTFTTTGTQIICGQGSGAVALTTNDGKGNANVTFNHTGGVPDVNGAALRIETNVDTSGAGIFYFEASGSAVTAGSSVDLDSVMTITTTTVQIPQKLQHMGDTDTYLRFRANDDMELVAGNRQMIRMDEGANPDILQFVVSTTYTDSSGNIVASGNVTAFASDERLKENIKPIENALDKIKAIRGVTYDWRDNVESLGFTPDRKKDCLGVIAQELESAGLHQVVQPAPFDRVRSAETDWEFVSKSGEEYKTVDYDKLTALCIQGIKEQQEIIETQQAHIDELIAMVRELKSGDS